MNSQRNSRTSLTKRIHTITVPLGERTYPIVIGEGVLRRAGDLFRKHAIGRTVVVMTDTTVARHHGAVLERSLRTAGHTVHTIALPSGEQQKSLAAAERIYTELLQRGIDRSATIVALGGGVIGDLAGFIAATYQRGLGFVQIPTTLLAQVDSSVGGKVGINHPLAKNMIGAFHQPRFVLIDPSVLRTLPKREMISGMGEVVKYGVILDARFFRFVERSLERAFAHDAAVLTAMIRTSCLLKAYVVATDEKEQHLRAILNFGHTIGHALEHAGRYSALKHGEAILYGMVAEARIALWQGMIDERQVDRLEQLVNRLPLPSLTPLRLRSSALLTTMMKDKKTLSGNIRMPLPGAIGSVQLPSVVERRFIEQAVQHLTVYGA
ncbi:MAG: 3-dehydroquinate synthase [Bacteroidetes bacterium]|nr:3-dehydroquinate synthase [Bacteroidota bacterium]